MHDTAEVRARRVLQRALEASAARRVDLGREICELRRLIAKLERSNKYLTERLAAARRRELERAAIAAIRAAPLGSEP